MALRHPERLDAYTVTLIIATGTIRPGHYLGFHDDDVEQTAIVLVADEDVDDAQTQWPTATVVD